MTPYICLVQPPFAQLNSPCPGIYYLRAFLERQGYTVIVRDHSIGLFEKIFCREGLARIFEDLLDTDHGPIAERFLSDKDSWLDTIDRTVAFLQGRDHEWGHFIGLANGILPGGPRFDVCLGELCRAKGEASAEDAPLLASKLLADIADLITVCLDSSFSLIRYVPSPGVSLGMGYRDFSIVRGGLGGYIMRNFYSPFLEEEWKIIAKKMPPFSAHDKNARLVLGVTIPFSGCLAGALVCAESARKCFGDQVVTVAGGGYVNTELRFIEEEQFFDFIDYLSFDRGYGSLDAVLRRITASAGMAQNDAPLYKTMYRAKNGVIVRDEKIADNGGIAAGDAADEGMRVDNEAAQTIFPDYSGLDFSRYIRPVDDINPMHRLWSDGRWLRVYAAHGCYWHNCAFCDTSLDYIRCYRPADAGALFRHLLAQAEKTGLRGVHLVDEACPPASLLRLALLNREAGLPLLFWGNIRFEKSFTPDTAAILAAGGVIGVSAGIEIASERGFARIGKGINLAGVVNACAAFKEAGILVHGYLIYGYWDEDDAEIIDSAETLRQLFEAGLLDSAFWHQFTLTRHSRIYAEKLRGLYSDLRVTGDPLCGNNAGCGRTGGGGKIFALNDLTFEGEERFYRWAAPLDSLLRLWMRGDTQSPVSGAFPFRVPEPAIPADLVPGLLGAYARERDKRQTLLPGAGTTALFLGSRPVMRMTAGAVELRWRRLFGECSLRLPAPDAAAKAEQTGSLLRETSRGGGMDAAELYSTLETIFGDAARRVWKKLRRQGLSVYSKVWFNTPQLAAAVNKQSY